MAVDLTDPKVWSSTFGLADSPLFGAGDRDRDAAHRVMLDGGHGTFALSIAADDVKPTDAASWSWSSDIPHHVGVSAQQVTVTRWDQMREPRTFSPSSVSERFDTFYRYLVQDRVQQSKNVVDHLVEQFRMVRTAMHQAGYEDRLGLEVFLALLSFLMSEETASPGVSEAVTPDARAAFGDLRDRELAPLIESVRKRRASGFDLDLHSPLAVRHAGGLLFQEAHFELMRAPAPDLFGFLSGPTLKPVTRGGAHFTPPSLARSVVDQTLAQFPDLQRRRALTLLDPACGSGAFLHEAVRGLERAGFNGRLTIVGMDISSPAAAMARFVMARAQSDWSPAGGMTWDIRIGDSLQPGAMPEADIIIMNPPFVAVGSLDKDQQDHIDRILGNLRKGRPDLSMAFILEALQKLRPGGALGCLFPSSLLELEAASLWRKAIAERSAIRFLALLGDHGLFAYALIQVGAAVFQRAEGDPKDPVLTLWTADEKEVTGEALRALRMIVRKGPPAAENREKWRVTWATKASVDEASSWRLRTPQTERLINSVRDAVGTVVEDLFDVRQGILKGSNEAFILTREEWAALPDAEKFLFKPALMNKSVEHGRFTPLRYVFYPYRNGALLLETEEELIARAPAYAQRLQRLKPALRNREGFEDQWWALTRRREWMDRAEPRIISKYFGGPGAFFPDMSGEVAVVQG